MNIIQLLHRKSSQLIGFFILYFAFSNLEAQDGSANSLPQFLFPSFTKGIVKMKDKREMTAILDYNTVDEEMIFNQQGVYMKLDNPQEIDTVYLQNRKFIPFDDAFYEVVANGPCPFYIQHKSRYTPVGTTTAYGIKSQTLGTTSVRTMQSGNQVRQIDVPEDVTVTPANVFWIKINDEMNKFNSEKQLLKLFPENEQKIKEFVKNNKINVKSEENLKVLGNFCNSLLKQ
jgi:hypothetical protein